LRLITNNPSVFSPYTFLSDIREGIQRNLKLSDIPSVFYYSALLPLQPVFENLGSKVGYFPVAEKVANQCLSLPLSPYPKENEQIKIIELLSHI
jgi:UDP-2-acetamido-2-deoxy-ribo-hexuluronate aminotransferase